MKVLVTRAAEQVGDLSLRLRHLGCEVIELPLIAIVDPPDGGAELRAAMSRAVSPSSPFAWIVLTSPNAAQRALRLVPRDPGVRIAAIGPGTAAVCGDLGFPVALVPDRSVGEGLVDAFPPAPEAPSGRSRILLPRAESARDVVPHGLRAKGWSVDVVTAYRTIPRTPTSGECAAASAADIALLTSSSTARALVAALGPGGLPPRVVSIGPQTTATLEQLGAHVGSTAEPHTLDGLIGEVERILGRR